MRKKIKYDKKYLKDIMRYAKVPVRQILGLDINLQEQALLMHLFSHNDTWGISFNQMSKSFGRKKNRKNIKQAIENIKRKGYLVEGLDSYHIDLEQIQKDYLKQQSKGDNPANTVSEISSLPVSEINKGVLAPLKGDVNQINREAVNPTHTNNINKKNNKDKKETNQTTNKIGVSSYSSSSSSSSKDQNEQDSKSNPPNDLQLVLDQEKHFRAIHRSSGFDKFDISAHSNQKLAKLAYIYLTKQYEKKNSKVLLFISLLVKYSYYSKGSTLYQEFVKFCHSINRQDVIKLL